jgi:hypothetical protein
MSRAALAAFRFRNNQNAFEGREIAMETYVKLTRRPPAAQAGVIDQNPTIKSIRAKRVAEEISGTLLARKAGIERTRLSFAECSHIQLSAAELQRLVAALDQLIAAKRQVQELATAVGWPA